MYQSSEMSHVVPTIKRSDDLLFQTIAVISRIGLPNKQSKTAWPKQSPQYTTHRPSLRRNGMDLLSFQFRHGYTAISIDTFISTT
jgi:hypothetical protein